MNRPDGAVKISTTLKDFFKNWLQFLKPFHGLSEKQIQLAAALLEERHRISQKITDDALLDAHILSTEMRRKIRESLGLPAANFQVILGDLRRHGFIIGNRINPKYIPQNLGSNPKVFTFLLYFSIEKDERSGEKAVQ